MSERLLLLLHRNLSAVCAGLPFYVGDVEAIRQLLQDNTTSNSNKDTTTRSNIELVEQAEEKYKWTALHFAAAHGHAEAIQLLLECHAEVDARNKYLDTPLHWATFSGHVAATRCLLEGGAEVDARHKDNLTPLHGAVLMRQLEVARLLLDWGAAVNATENHNSTPLHVAALLGELPLLRLLLERGGDPSLKNSAPVPNSTLTEGGTPLQLAASQGHEEAVALLQAYHKEEGHTPEPCK